MNPKSMIMWNLCVLVLIIPFASCRRPVNEQEQSRLPQHKIPELRPAKIPALIGCYKDTFFRAMTFKKVVKSVEECINICQENRLSPAGVQHGKQCFCGGNYKKYGTSKKCTMKCKSGEICGGTFATSVYKVEFQQVKLPAFIGCYKDKIIRAMTFKKDVKSIGECIEACKKSGLSPAAVQYGIQCFCGGDYTKYGPAKNCNMKCKSGEICGGFFASSVYEVGEPDCYCSASGDPHYRAFDGQMIHFMGICKYTLATNTKGAPHFFAVEVKNEHRGNTRVSYTRMVDVKLKSVTIRLLPRNIVLVNSEKKSLPINSDLGYAITYSGRWVTVSTEWGLRVQFDGKHRVSVKVPSTFSNKLTGICGNCNRKKDDYRTKEGKDVSKERNRFSLIGNSFKVADDSDQPQTKCDVTDVNMKCPAAETRRCDAIMHATFGACRKKLGPIRVKEYIESCKIDTCMYQGNKENSNTVFCESIEGFVRECEKSGIAVNWRKVSKCALKCDLNKVYQFNAFECQPSCTNRKPKCTARAEGCVCKKGFVLSGDKCVHVSKCGCVHKGNYLNLNEVFTDSKCKSKVTCQLNGKVKTENMKPCGANSVCGLDDGVRGCVCNKGFYLLGENCVSTEVQQVKLPAFIGCYKDKIFRAMTLKKNVKSIGECIEVCKKSGLSPAGLQYGKQCFCGGDYAKYGPAKNCNMKCKSGEICGGFFASSVYEVGEPDCYCSASGDPHYRAFDGQMIHFMGICKYTLATNTTGAPHFFAVEVKNEHRANTRVSYTRMVDVKLKSVTIRLLPRNIVLVNGEKKSLPINSDLDYAITYSGRWVTVSTEWGLRVQFDGKHRVSVKVPGTFSNKLTGICGNCNRKKDDYRTKEGKDVSKERNRFSLIGNSFKVTDDSDKPQTKCDVIDINMKCPAAQTRGCNIIMHATFGACRKKLGPIRVKEYIESCEIDTCMYQGNKENSNTVFCESIEGFVRECEKSGIAVNWRRVSKCALKCDSNKVYQFDAFECQPSCANRKTKCTARAEGCVCKNGFVLSGDKCVHVSKCGCVHKGNYLNLNAVLIDSKCQSKVTCQLNGKVKTEEMKPCGANSVCGLVDGVRGCVCDKGFLLQGGKCVSTEKPDCYCSASGDPHYRAFDGQMIHFMGICKYTLATNTTGAPHFFAVEVKNEHRANTRVSYTRMVDVKLRSVTIRLLPRNIVLVNGEKTSLPINSDLGYAITYSGRWVTVSIEWGLRVQFDGKHRVSVKVPGTFSNKLTGICGNCNGKKDDYRTKEGKDVSKERNRFSLIGNSFKVADDSDKPQTKCDVIDINMKCPAAQTRRCNIIMHATFGACRKKLGPIRVKEYIESCEIDTCMYQGNKENSNTVFCESIEGFVRECEKSGIAVNWRRVSKCALKCDSNKVYLFNAFECQPSCANRKPKCTARAEGCVCKNGFVLSGDKCVHVSKCGCVHKGNYLNLNAVLIDSKCQSKVTCQINGKVKTEKMKPCGANSVCGLVDGVRGCVCDKGFLLQGGKCVSTEKPDCYCSASGDPHYRAFDGQMIHFMGICKYTLATNTTGAPHFFAVEVKNEHRANTRVSYTRMVDVKLRSDTIRLLPRNIVLVNGEKTSLPINSDLGYAITYSGRWVTVSTEWGLRVQFDGKHRVSVKVPGTFSNKLTGICGNCNGKKDDYRTKEGKDVSKERNRFSLIGNSFKVADDSDKPQTKCDVIDINMKCPAAQTRRCNIIMHATFGACRKKLGPIRVKEYIESCEIDTCMYQGNKENSNTVFCESIEGFVRECEKSGIAVNWRKVSKCALKCDSNKVYLFNAFECQPSCANRKPKCTARAEGCVCKNGFVLSGDKCVHVSKCGCVHKGNYLNLNAVLIDSKCQSKVTCQINGKVKTEKMKPCGANSVCGLVDGVRGCVCDKGFLLQGGKCVSTEKPDCYCSASGDPHYRAFDGQMIHFMGICKYTLATNTTGAPHFFAVEVKNEHRANTRVSYTRMVDVKLRSVTIRLLPRNIVLVNGEKTSLPINSDLGYAITYSGRWVTVSIEWGLRVQFDGKHRVSVKVPGTFSNKLTGICGNCNGKKDDYRTKEGEDVSKKRNRFSLIGNSFKVVDDSDKPQTKCDVIDINMKCPAAETRRCNIIMHATFGACRKKLGPIRVKEYIESCEIDTCMYQGNKENSNTVFCESIEGFVRECEKSGIAVNWRRVSKCALKCDLNKVYQFNAFECQPSCTNRKPKCTARAEGCVCKKGFVLSGDKCVHVSKCGCVHKGNYLNLNAVLIDSKCQSKITCQLNGKVKTEKMKPCGANSACGLVDGVRGCECKKGFHLKGGNCVSTVDPCGIETCKNGGICKRAGQKYTCECIKGFIGKHCEKVDPCGLKPCKNGGTCKRDGEKYTCECKKQFMGKHCENVDPCGLKPCKNGGTCKRDGEKYTCECKKQFMGKHCEKANFCQRKPCKNGGVCTNTDSGHKCSCNNNFTGKNCEKRIPDCVCSASGDPHYKAFDGQWVHFMGICKYTLAASNETSKLPHFTVEVKNEHRGNTRVSYTRAVDLKINGETIRLLAGSLISINGELLNLPIKNYMGVSAVYSAGWIKVTTSFDVKVQFDGKHRVIVRVPSIYRNQLTGICGDCNGKRDDYKTKAGVDVSQIKNRYTLIGKSYQVMDDSDKPEKNCEVVDFVEKCENKEVNACTLLTNKKGPFAECLRKLGSEAKEYFKACQMDACAYKNSSKVLKMVVCQAYEALAKKCEDLNVLINWRTKAKCPMKCSKDKIFAFKMSACQPSCTDRKPVCADGFTEGCVCKPGTILSGDKCIPPSSCGCQFEGIYLTAGSDILLNDCSERIVCDARGKLKRTPGCHANTMCVVQGGVRKCACEDGFQMLNGMCREILIPPPPIINPEFLGPVLHMFIRVSVAVIEGTPIDTISTKLPKECARHCLKIERCKSFNFDLLLEKCQLFSINAENHTLLPGSCPYQDYYQLIRSKNIVIRGAAMFTCVHLNEYAEVKNIAECKGKCINDKCKAMEYSVFDEECSVTHTTRADFGLIGDDDFVYYETLDYLPQLPVN